MKFIEIIDQKGNHHILETSGLTVSTSVSPALKQDDINKYSIILHSKHLSIYFEYSYQEERDNAFNVFRKLLCQSGFLEAVVMTTS